MTYPPQGQPGDPYGQPQPGSQPPGGYEPGQPQYTQPEQGYPAPGPGYGAPPNPGYGSQPDPGYGSQPGYPPQPGYGPPTGQPAYAPQPGYPDPYGQYGPPPVQPTSRGGAGTAILVVVVLILMIGGGVAGYLLLGDSDDEATTTAGDETTAESSDEPDDSDSDDDQAPPPAGDALTVASLGATTPLPGDPWVPRDGPGALGNLSTDAQSMIIEHEPNWISYLEVGLYDGSVMPYDPTDLEGTVGGTMDSWTNSMAFGSVTGMEIGDTEFTEVEVDGRPGVLAEARLSWDSSENTSDLREDIAILLVDADGVNGFIAMASVPESGADFYGPTLEAILGTTFEGESA